MTVKLFEIYISGPIEHNPTYDDDFGRAEEILFELGWAPEKIINPVTLCKNVGLTEWHECIALDIEAMPKTAGSLCRLPGWQFSNGSQLEISIARLRGLKIYDIDLVERKLIPGQ